MYRRLRFAWCRSTCRIISGPRTLAVRQPLIARPANVPTPTLVVPGWPAPVAVGPDLPSVAAQLIKLWR
jgi:hypothetical protein